jgi:hypothetical protein
MQHLGYLEAGAIELEEVIANRSVSGFNKIRSEFLQNLNRFKDALAQRMEESKAGPKQIWDKKGIQACQKKGP